MEGFARVHDLLSQLLTELLQKTEPGDGQKAGVVIPDSGLTLVRTNISIASATTTTIVEATAAQTINIYGLFLYNGNTAGNVTVRDSTPTTIDGIFQFPANFGFLWALRANTWKALAVGTALEIVTSGAGQLSGHVWTTKG